MKNITFKKFGRFGRLGNQLWQLCSITGLVKQHNEENNENYQAVFPDWELKDFFSFPDHWFVDDQTVQKSRGIDELITNKDDFYFVNKNFLKSIEHDIEEWLQPSDKAKNMLSEQIEKYKPKNKTAIHVRRGDYLIFAGGRNLLPKEYYQKNLPESGALIFSDDPIWCEENFPNVDIVRDNSPWMDLMLMRMCKAHVIANSTFSWWGAYGSKDVTYPDPWYQSGRVNIGLDFWKKSFWF